MLRFSFNLLFLVTILAGTQALKFESWGNVSFAAINGYYLVSKNNSHISIRSPDASFEACDLDFTDAHIGKIQAAAFESKVLLLFRQNSTTFRMLQLDPVLCLYHPLPSLNTFAGSKVDPQIILLNNTVDIFLRGHENCLPCRFDVNGYRLGVTGQLAQSELSLFKSFIVKEFFLQEQEVRNYVLVGHFEDGTSVLKVLDQNFSTTKELYFNSRVEALAANSVKSNHGFDQPWIGITYVALKCPSERVLALYTNNLVLLFETCVKRDTDHTIHDTLLSIASTGQAVVNFIEVSPSSTWQYSSFAVYDPKGQLGFNAYAIGFSRDAKYDWQFFSRDQTFCCAVHEYQAKITTSNMLCYSINAQPSLKSTVESELLVSKR